jgi:hypothetical protein
MEPAQKKHGHFRVLPRWSMTKCRIAGMAGFVVFASAVAAAEVTLEKLMNDPKLTPRRFANHFADFDYEYQVYVQPAEKFLAARSGDCDDYAVLADHVLKQKGYRTRLIHIRMVGMYAHAVCYVAENKAYLDYNNRKYTINLEKCGPTLRDIAEKVAKTAEANWTSVTEFTYSYEEDRKKMGITVVKTEPPENDPDRRKG